jgi:hypothetical protein
MIWLEETLGHDKNGNPNFRIIDIVDIPAIKGYELTAAINKGETSGLCGYVKIENASDFHKVWAFDKKNLKLIEISPEGWRAARID